MSIELRTHTGLWHVEKKLYSFYDVALPFPVSLRQIAVVIGFGVPWFWVMAAIGVTFGPPFGHLLYLAPPAALAWASGRPLMEGKTIGGLIGSQLKYAGESRKLARLRPYNQPDMVVARCELWHPGHVQDRTLVEEPQSLIVMPGSKPRKRPTAPDQTRRPRTTSQPRATRPAKPVNPAPAHAKVTTKQATARNPGQGRVPVRTRTAGARELQPT